MKNHFVKVWPVIVVLLFILTAFGLSSCGQNNLNGLEVYRIGAILPLTGQTSMLGEFIKNGLDTAVQNINQAGGVNNKKIEIVYEDSKNEAKEGVAAYNRLLSVHNTPVVISAMSSVTNALIPLADQDHLPLFATTVSSAGITTQGDYIFRLFITADIDATAMAEYAANKLQLSKIAIIHVNDDFGLNYKKVFSDKFSENSGQVVWAGSFNKGETNFRDLITKLGAYDFQAIYLLGYENGLGLLVKQLREADMVKPILSIATIAEPYVMEQAGGSSENIYFTSTLFDPHLPKSEADTKFIKRFKAQFREVPNYYSAFAYDAIFLLAEAIKNQGYTPDGIKAGLINIKDYQGVIGAITIGPDRDASFPMVIKKIEKGKVVDAQ